jgi:hypothetical protein
MIVDIDVACWVRVWNIVAVAARKFVEVTVEITELTKDLKVSFYSEPLTYS